MLKGYWNSEEVKSKYLTLQLECQITQIEMNFSAAGNILTEKRTSLDPEKVNDMLVIKSNIGYLKLDWGIISLVDLCQNILYYNWPGNWPGRDREYIFKV